MGAILVVWAVALVAIMGLVAMAIDLGNIAQTKQHTANAVEAAVLSAVQDLAQIAPGGTGNIAMVEQQAITDAEWYLTQNYKSKNLPAVGSASYLTGCPGAFPGLTPYGGPSSCFAFFNPANPSGNPNAMGLAIPRRTVYYSFGRVVGLRSQAVSSVAYASIQTASSGYLLPFGYPSATQWGLQCIKASTNSRTHPCPGFQIGSGQFGYIINPRYTVLADSPAGTVSKSSSNNPDVLTNELLGIDHQLYAVGGQNPFGTNAIVCDWPISWNKCPGPYYDGSSPSFAGGNQVYASTGDAINEMASPMFDGGVVQGGCTLSVPRLNHPDGFLATNSCVHDNPTTGPTFIDSSGHTQAPYVCLDSTYGDTYGDISTTLCNSNNTSGHYNLNGLSIAAYVEGTAAAPCESDPHVWQDNPIDETTNGSKIDTNPGSKWSATSLYWYPYDQCLSDIMKNEMLLTSSANDYALSSGPLFSSNIEKSPRFGIVPVVNNSCGGKCFQPITSFLGTYLDVALPQGGKPGALMAWVFPLSWIDSSGGSTSGGGIGQELGGNYVTNLCALLPSVGAPYGGNC